MNILINNLCIIIQDLIDFKMKLFINDLGRSDCGFNQAKCAIQKPDQSMIVRISTLTFKCLFIVLPFLKKIFFFLRG